MNEAGTCETKNTQHSSGQCQTHEGTQTWQAPGPKGCAAGLTSSSTAGFSQEPRGMMAASSRHL